VLIVCVSVCVCVRMSASLCGCVYNSHPEVVTLMPAQTNVFSILRINAPSEGLEVELLLSQAKVLAR